MRKDAARSRRAILDAARRLYADDTTASFAEIAHGAGVGQATVYRHFDDRQALLAELAIEDMERLERRVDAEPLGPAVAGSPAARADRRPAALAGADRRDPGGRSRRRPGA